MNYDHNKDFGLSKFLSGYRKFYLNSQKGYSRKIRLNNHLQWHIIKLFVIIFNKDIFEIKHTVNLEMIVFEYLPLH